MSASDLHSRLQEAITLAQAGQRSEARAALHQIVETDPNQELAWLWLATVSSERAERIGYLERALALNPDNVTSRQAYAQLTGQDYVAPASSGAGETAGRRGALQRESSFSLEKIIALMVVAAVGVAAIVVALNLRDEDGEGTPPTRAPVLAPATVALTPTPLFSPTPSNTPRPTFTPGPSPTSIWDNPPPTWTSAPTLTLAPSSTPLPTSTPQPTHTATPTALPPTATEPGPLASLTPPPLFPAEEAALSTVTLASSTSDQGATADVSR